MSRRRAVAADASGRALPWYTYPAIRFLSDRLPQGISVFEYGSGYSTHWWSKRASHVTSCEHDLDWFRRVSEMAADNVKLMHRALDEGYTQSAVEAGRKFDVVAIDGRRSVECARNALAALSDGGIIVWDNADLDRYSEGYEFLKSNDFKRIDFWEICPLNAREWSTAVFYRPGNCLDL